MEMLSLDQIRRQVPKEELSDHLALYVTKVYALYLESGLGLIPDKGFSKISKAKMPPGFKGPFHVIDYSILRVFIKTLGQGGFKNARKSLFIDARHTPPKVYVGAEKRLNKWASVSSKDEMIREAALLASLSHPYIMSAPLYTYERDGKYTVVEECMAMDLITYLHEIDGEGALEAIKKLMIFFKQVMVGAKYLNEKGIVHRDIKLDNILVDKGFTSIKIADFDRFFSNTKGFMSRLHEKRIELRESMEAPLDEPIYLALLSQLPYGVMEPLAGEYEAALPLDITAEDRLKADRVKDYLREWGKFVSEQNTPHVGTPECIGLRGNIPPEFSRYRMVTKKTHQFAIGSMIECATNNLKEFLTPGQLGLLIQLYKDLIFKRVKLHQAMSQMDEIIESFPQVRKRIRGS